ncbi:MAG TPA: type II toxin-antitoxin system Phd/YefM family antitoxin [Spirochaetota bacterium]|nr:type II toxin-antitoxin system Phd/YefM family antitoxin [Spirochaetota bacterium]HPR49604.1 type II toxin-antitoxin system Phd/YefM family antitoxin [Spirochaetota bacterium]
MKFITVRDLRTKPSSVWGDLKKEQELIITNNGKPIALLTPLAEDTLEESLDAVRKARASEALRAMREDAVRKGTSDMSMDQIDREIKKYRAGK